MKTDTVIVGAGVIGLAIAREIAKEGHEVVVLEKNPRAGEETSSRNSGVIHSGIYYPSGSNKALFCVEGNRLLYEYARARNIGYRNTGKLVVATSSEEVEQLEQLQVQGKENAVEGLELLSKKRVENIQPEIKAELAMLSPSSGIIDAADLILSLEADLQQKGVILSCNAKVENISKGNSGFFVQVNAEENYTVEADTVINCAGLHAIDIAKKIEGLDKDLIPTAYYGKGHYFQLSGYHPFKEYLVYPLHNKDSLGVHVSIDVSGKARFGPDLTWIENLDYSFDESLKEKYVKSIRTYWPYLNPDKLSPDYTGIRPKIYSPQEEPADFLVQTATEHNIEGLINLLGIESPGLTSSLSLAKKVSKLLF